MTHLRLAEIMSDLRKGGRLNADDWALLCEMQALLLSMGVNSPQTPRTSGAERQARYRDKRNALRNGDVTSDVTGDTLSPPKKISNPPLPPQTLRVCTPKQGKRLPEDWTPSESLFSWGQELGLSAETLKFETESFCDHFWSSARANATKRDWNKTWQNWMREAKRRERKKNPTVVDFRPGSPKPAFRPEPPKLSNEEWKKLKEKSR
jgi:hypothetical protein